MKKLLFICVLILSQTALLAQRASIQGGPWLTAVTQTGFTVVWTTDHDAIGSVAVAPMPEEDRPEHFYCYERPEFWSKRDGIKTVGRHHIVKVDGLEPGTTYRFRVMNRTVREVLPTGIVYGELTGTSVRDDVFTVTTHSTEKEEVRFQIVNDIHGRDTLLRQLLADVRETDTDMVFLNGDMQNSMTGEQQIFGDYLQSLSELFATHIPFYFARGNHETRGPEACRFLEYFPTVSGASYYSFREGPVTFVVIDGVEGKPGDESGYYGITEPETFFYRQLEWMKELFSSEEFRNSPVKILISHFSLMQGNEYSSQRMRELYLDLINDAGFDAGFSGHTHRHLWSNAGTGNVNFPIMTNAASEKAVVTVSSGNIDIRTYNASGVQTHAYSLEPDNDIRE